MQELAALRRHQVVGANFDCKTTFGLLSGVTDSRQEYEKNLTTKEETMPVDGVIPHHDVNNVNESPHYNFADSTYSASAIYFGSSLNNFSGSLLGGNSLGIRSSTNEMPVDGVFLYHGVNDVYESSHPNFAGSIYIGDPLNLAGSLENCCGSLLGGGSLNQSSTEVNNMNRRVPTQIGQHGVHESSLDNFAGSIYIGDPLHLAGSLENCGGSLLGGDWLVMGQIMSERETRVRRHIYPSCLPSISPTISPKIYPPNTSKITPQAQNSLETVSHQSDRDHTTNSASPNRHGIG